MARLDGAKTNTGPYIVGAIILALLAAGAFYYLKSKGSQTENAQTSLSSGMPQTSTTPSDNEVSNNQVSSSATPSDGASSNGTDAGSGTMTPSATDAGSANSMSPSPEGTPPADASSTPTADAASTPGASSTPDASSTPVASGSSAPGATSAPSAQKTPTNGVVAKRSKTITNHKTGTTVTYSKEIHKDGTVTHDKKTGTVPVRP